jgi:hypothetical protein
MSFERKHPAIAMLEQEFFTVDEIAKLLTMRPDSIARQFGNEPGVIDLGSPETRHKGRYRVLRIPATVLNRLLHKTQVQAWRHRINSAASTRST